MNPVAATSIDVRTAGARRGMEETYEKHLARVQFTALLTDPPSVWNQAAVSAYHQIVSALEKAYGITLVLFRVPDSEMRQRPGSIQRAPLSGRHAANVRMLEGRNCDERSMKRRMNGIRLLLEKLEEVEGRQESGRKR